VAEQDAATARLGLQELRRAGVEDIASIDGISRALAERIHAALRGEG
jgi:excinuclease UvrABC nuclease subunit